MAALRAKGRWITRALAVGATLALLPGPMSTSAAVGRTGERWCLDTENRSSVTRSAQEEGFGRQAGVGNKMIVPTGPGPEERLELEEWKHRHPVQFDVACKDAFLAKHPNLGDRDNDKVVVNNVEPDEGTLEKVIEESGPVLIGVAAGALLTGRQQKRERLNREAEALDDALAELDQATTKLVTETEEGEPREEMKFLVLDRARQLSAKLATTAACDERRAAEDLGALVEQLKSPIPEGEVGKARKQKAREIEQAGEKVRASAATAISEVRKTAKFGFDPPWGKDEG